VRYATPPTLYLAGGRDKTAGGEPRSDLRNDPENAARTSRGTIVGGPEPPR